MSVLNVFHLFELMMIEIHRRLSLLTDCITPFIRDHIRPIILHCTFLHPSFLLDITTYY